MENIQVMLSPAEIFNNKKLISNKMHGRILEETEEISKSLDNLKIVNDEDKRLFLNAVNHCHRDLCEVIFHLRQIVIKIDSDDQGVHDMHNVITELNKIVLLAQELLNLEIEKLKIELKRIIIDLGAQVENLMIIIEYDNLHEHKQKVLDCQHDLVLAVQALKLYCQVSYLNGSELDELVNELFEKIKNNLSQIKISHKHMAEDFSHYTRRSLQITHRFANYMQKMVNTTDIHKDSGNCFKNAVDISMQYMSDVLEALTDDNPISKLLEVLENNCQDHITNGCLIMQKGLQTAMEKTAETTSYEREKLLFTHVCICNWINCTFIFKSEYRRCYYEEIGLMLFINKVTWGLTLGAM